MSKSSEFTTKREGFQSAKSTIMTVYNTTTKEQALPHHQLNAKKGSFFSKMKFVQKGSRPENHWL